MPASRASHRCSLLTPALAVAAGAVGVQAARGRSRRGRCEGICRPGLGALRGDPQADGRANRGERRHHTAAAPLCTHQSCSMTRAADACSKRVAEGRGGQRTMMRSRDGEAPTQLRRARKVTTPGSVVMRPLGCSPLLMRGHAAAAALRRIVRRLHRPGRVCSLTPLEWAGEHRSPGARAPELHKRRTSAPPGGRRGRNACSGPAAVVGPLGRGCGAG